MAERRTTKREEQDLIRKNHLKNCLSHISNGFSVLRDSIQLEDLNCLRFSDQKKEFMDDLKKHSINPIPDNSVIPYKLDKESKEMKISEDLLVFLSYGTQESLERFGQVFMLHEILHNVFQGIHNGNYSGIGRAGILVERIDYTADSFALCVCISWNARIKPQIEVNIIAREFVKTVLNGLQAFDFDPKKIERNRKKQKKDGDDNEGNESGGLVLKKMTETRARRYLIWALLYERLSIVKNLDDLISVLRDEKIKIQITPLKFTLNREKDTVIHLKRIHQHKEIMANQVEETQMGEAMEDSDDDDEWKGKKKKKRENKREIPYRIFIELNSYFYRIDNDTLAVDILDSLFHFDWNKMHQHMAQVHSVLPPQVTRPFF